MCPALVLNNLNKGTYRCAQCIIIHGKVIAVPTQIPHTWMCGSLKKSVLILLIIKHFTRLV